MRNKYKKSKEKSSSRECQKYKVKGNKGIKLSEQPINKCFISRKKKNKKKPKSKKS